MSTNKEIQIDDLFGTWMLVSMQRTIVETEEIVDLNPDGPPLWLPHVRQRRAPACS
jgi:hypothetical protein